MRVPGLDEPNMARVIHSVRALAEGGTNAIGQEIVTLTAAATETVVTDRQCMDTSLPVLVPVSANAGEVAWWIKTVAKGTFTIGHPAAPANARFRYELRRP